VKAPNEKGSHYKGNETPCPAGAQRGATLERLAGLLDDVADACRELAQYSEIPIDGSRDSLLMKGVESQAQPRPVKRSFLTVGDVAELLQLDQKTIRRWRADGKLPSAFVNGSIVRWRAEVIDDWIADQEMIG
jgi:excisionase family DNA binding protein